MLINFGVWQHTRCADEHDTWHTESTFKDLALNIFSSNITKFSSNAFQLGNQQGLKPNHAGNVLLEALTEK